MTSLPRSNLLQIVVADLPLAKESAVWGTFGRGGYEHCRGTCKDHQLQYKKLIDCDDEHLHNLLNPQWAVPESYRTIIRSILKDRGYEPEPGVFLPESLLAELFPNAKNISTVAEYHTSTPENNRAGVQIDKGNEPYLLDMEAHKLGMHALVAVHDIMIKKVFDHYVLDLGKYKVLVSGELILFWR